MSFLFIYLFIPVRVFTVANFEMNEKFPKALGSIIPLPALVETKEEEKVTTVNIQSPDSCHADATNSPQRRIDNNY